MTIRPEDKEAFKILGETLRRCQVRHWGSRTPASEEEIQRREPIQRPAEHGVLVYTLPEKEGLQSAPGVVREWVFIDGSPRTVRGRDALINGNVVPLFTAEVAGGSSALRNSHWEAFERTIQRCVLVPHAKDFALLPKTLPGGWSIVDPLDDGITLADVYDEVCAAAVRRTRWLMRRVERALALHLVQEGEDVVADGPLSDWRPLWQLPSHIMGVIKRRIMTPEVWDDQGRCTSSLWLSDLLRQIKVGARSPIFRFFPWALRGQSTPPPDSTQSFTITWWVRLRAPRPGDSPFSHLIRVELPPTTPLQGAALTYKVDRITCGLLACQSPYLIDNIRGGELLYPIWVAETMAKVSLRPTVIHLALWS